MNRVFIAGAKRSAIGRFGGSLRDTPCTRIAIELSKAVIRQAKVESSRIDQVIVGNVLMADQGMGPGRQVGIGAGVSKSSPGYTVNMLCGSGMKALMIAAGDIMLGRSQLTLAGGMENMSQAPYLVSSKVRWGSRMGSMELQDSINRDGLIDIFTGEKMGITAENLAKQWKISRERQDEFALNSQMRTKSAIQCNRFKDEIEPIQVTDRKKSIGFSVDEHPRPDTKASQLAALRPVFLENGSVTVGNASGINDGAGMLLLASKQFVENEKIEPLAELVHCTQTGIEPRIMGLAPALAIENLLQQSGHSIKDVDLFEINEAFAAQVLAVLAYLENNLKVSIPWLMERTNLNGGAIALGHPVGASGARIVITLLYEMLKRNLKTGVASLCIGGGMGTAVLIKRV